MGSANTTPNYGLNQWAGNEYPKRTDFNDDFAKIDTQMKANHDFAAAAATLHYFTVTIPTTWSGAGPYTQIIAVSGIAVDDKLFVGPVYDSDPAVRAVQRDMWGMVTRIDAGTNSITITCDNDAPDTAIPIQIEVIR